MKYFIPVIIVVLTVSCNSGTNRTNCRNLDSLEIAGDERPKDSTEKNTLDFIRVDTSLGKDPIEYNFSNEIKSGLKRWLGYYQKTLTGFDISDYKNVQTNVIRPYQVPLQEKEELSLFFSLYGPYLIWSPDSLKALDLFSYRRILYYDDSKRIRGMYDVDCQAGIIDLKKQKRINLLTCGTACEFQDACWIGNDSIIITLTEENNDGSCEPVYEMISLRTFLCRTYRSARAYRIKSCSYVDNKFRGIVFD
jgi:hypothetical protein